METFLRALEAYQRFDPAGWVNLFRVFPPWWGAALVGVGVVLLLWGGGEAFRFIAGPLGAGAGLIWAPVVAIKLGFQAQAQLTGVVATVAIGGLGLLYPPAATFFAVGIPLGMVAGQMAGANDWLLGFIPGLFLGGIVAIAAHRFIAAIVSSFAGAWLLVLGVMAAMFPLTSRVEQVAQQPWGLLIAALLFAIAGCVYQLFVKLTLEERRALRAQHQMAKKRREETEAIENRWANYSKDKGLD